MVNNPLFFSYTPEVINAAGIAGCFFFWPPKKNISGDPWEHFLGRRKFLFNRPFGDFATAPSQTFDNEPMVDPDQKTYGQRVSNGLKGFVFFSNPKDLSKWNFLNISMDFPYQAIFRGVGHVTLW